MDLYPLTEPPYLITIALYTAGIAIWRWKGLKLTYQCELCHKDSAFKRGSFVHDHCMAEYDETENEDDEIPYWLIGRLFTSIKGLREGYTDEELREAIKNGFEGEYNE